MNLVKLLTYVSLIAAILFVLIVAGYTYRVAIHQKKLKKTLVLIRLKRSKIPYYILSVLFVVLSVTFFVLMANVESEGMSFFYLALAIVFLTSTVLLIISMFTKAAIASNGIYLFTRFIPWHNLYYYFIDEERCSVVVSSNDTEWMSFSGASLPLKFNKEDLDRVKTILANNKSPFIKGQEL